MHLPFMSLFLHSTRGLFTFKRGCDESHVLHLWNVLNVNCAAVDTAQSLAMQRHATWWHVHRHYRLKHLWGNGLMSNRTHTHPPPHTPTADLRSMWKWWVFSVIFGTSLSRSLHSCVPVWNTFEQQGSHKSFLAVVSHRQKKRERLRCISLISTYFLRTKVPNCR